MCLWQEIHKYEQIDTVGYHLETELDFQLLYIFLIFYRNIIEKMRFKKQNKKTNKPVYVK